MQAILAALIDQPGRLVGSLFESHPAYAARRRCEIPVLIAIVIIAGIVRFWGVGSFGLHKPDEDTTALPAVHILQDGTPRFPSGMFYGRAIAQSYLIAGAVKVFGQNEWALRLPSVLTGIAVVVLAYFLGRRFLEPTWNLAFVAVVALLPGMIADSQEARMYVFLSASLAAYMILVFRWERTGRTSALISAVVTMLVAIQFQEIAIFSSLLLLFPGLVHGDQRKLHQGLFALVVIAAGHSLIAHWIGSFYPKAASDVLPVVSQTGDAPRPGALRFDLIILVPVIVIAGALAWLNVRNVSRRALAITAGALLYAGLLSQALLLYHLAAILVIAGLVVARRNGGAPGFAVGLLLAGGAMVTLAHVALLHGANIGSGRKIIGVMVGQPSIWPYLQVADYSPLAMLLVAAGLGAGLWRLAGGARIDDYLLFAMLGVLAPLFAIGFFGWYIPPRYGEFALLPMLLCALAAAQRLVSERIAPARAATALPVVCLATITFVAIVNPLAVARGIDAGNRFADHKQAADYMRSIKLAPNDIIIAEEALMQTYYLGHIDYWLTGPRNAADFVVHRNGQLVDEYTNAPVIYTAAAFRKLIDKADRGAIYVIGSGENQSDGRLALRGPEISRLLQEPEFVTVYVAPDGLTRIWKIAAPTATAEVKG